MLVPTLLLTAGWAARADVGAVVHQCDVHLTASPTLAAALAPSPTSSAIPTLTTLRNLRYRIEHARQFMGTYLAPEDFARLDEELARAVRLNTSVSSPKIAPLLELYGRLLGNFDRDVRARAGGVAARLRSLLEHHRAKSHDVEVVRISEHLRKLEDCAADLDAERCAQVWLRAQTVATGPVAVPVAVPAAAPAPSARYFNKIRTARHRVALARANFARYGSAADFDRLDALLADAVARKLPPDSPEMLPLVTHFRMLEDRFKVDFAANSASLVRRFADVIKDMHRRGIEQPARRLERLVERIDQCRASLDVDACADDWDDAYAAFADLPRPGPKAPAWARMLGTTVTIGAARPTGGDFAFVDGLTALGSEARRHEFRSLLQIKYLHPSAIKRETYRATERAAGRKFTEDRYAQVPNLDTALSMFVEPPHVVPDVSKVILQGKIDLHGTVTEIDVTFDPRTRYFTVQVPNLQYENERYYQILIERDGRLRVLDLPPVTMGESARALELTHFAY